MGSGEDGDKCVADYILAGGREGKAKVRQRFSASVRFERALCAVMLKRFPHIESFHSVSGSDTRTVQWAVAAAGGTTAERRRLGYTGKK